ncbi:MAG: hypothetical protein AAGK97_16540 [Bacteroidota bacterium]
MAAINIPTYKEEEEDWSSYIERLECYFAVKNVAEDKKVQTLIIGLQPKQYQVLKDLVAPDTPVSKTYAEITSLLLKHYCGSKNPRVERTRFRQICRNEGETLQSYSVRLKHASRFCEFGNSLDEMLVDQLISGVRSKCIVNKILEVTDGLKLTFAKALQIAETAEVNETNAKMYAAGIGSRSDVRGSLEVKNTIYSQNVNKVKFRPKHKSVINKPTGYHVSNSDKIEKKCFRCASTSHLADSCKYKNVKCHKCQRVGHLAVACQGGRVPKSQNSVYSGSFDYNTTTMPSTDVHEINDQL